MKAVILVGGEGTRLRPLTYSTPKQMLKVSGITMIERVLEHLKSHGIDEAVLSLGYKPEPFLKAFPDGIACGVKLSYALESEPLDTAGAIRFAARYGNISETFVVCNGDVLTDLDISEVLNFHCKHGGDATIALTPVEDPSRYGVVPTDPTGKVEAFIEKPPRDQAPTNLINAGTYVFEPQVLDLIESDRRVSIERETFPKLVAKGSLFAIGSHSYWIDAGTKESYMKASFDLIGSKRPVPLLPSFEEVDANICFKWRE